MNKEREQSIQLLAGHLASCLTALRTSYKDAPMGALLPRAKDMAVARVMNPPKGGFSPSDFRWAFVFMMRNTAEGERLWLNVVTAFVEALRREEAKKDAANVTASVTEVSPTTPGAADEVKPTGKGDEGV